MCKTPVVGKALARVPMWRVARKMLLVTAMVGCVSERRPGRSDDVERWTLDPAVRIGSADGAHDAFGRIVSILADDVGSIYVADAQADEVRVFDSTGAYRSTIGRSGRGPGELGDLYALAWLGDTLAASDPRNARIALFRKDGSWVGHFGYQPLTGPPLFLRLHRADRATFYARIVLPRAAGVEAAYVRYRGGPGDTVAGPDPDPRAQATSIVCFGTDGGIRGFGVPFAGTPLFTFTADGTLVVAWSADYRIAFVRGDDTLRVVSRELPAVPVTEAEWDSATADYRAYRERDPGGRCEGGQMDRPSSKAALRHYWLDPESRLWVERVTPEGFAFDVFDGAGRLVATMAAPPRDERVEPYVRAGRVYLVRSDQLGVQAVEGFRIVEAEP